MTVNDTVVPRSRRTAPAAGAMAFRHAQRSPESIHYASMRVAMLVQSTVFHGSVVKPRAQFDGVFS